MDQNNYTPIRLLKQNNENDFSSIKRHVCNARIKGADKLTVQGFIDTMTDDFHEPVYPLIKEYLYTLFYTTMAENDPEFVKSIESKNSSLSTEIKDVFLYPVLLHEWAKSKQVFKPDPDFAEALLYTEKFCITKDMVDHLPYYLFYIDLSDIPIFAPIDGVFAYVKRYGDIACINLYSITHNLTYFSFYMGIGFDENDCSIIDLDQLQSTGARYDTYVPSLFRTDSVIQDMHTDTQINRTEVYAFALQLIAYLSIDEPQLTESDFTKNTYKPMSMSSKIRNKWSEVRIQDVGVRYGNNFRKVYSSNKVESDENETENDDETTSTKRKSPIPHFRCAHWHKFWVGKGRTQLKVKWVAPVFVGNGNAKDVVIHKIDD